jgi:hypothetical protein
VQRGRGRWRRREGDPCEREQAAEQGDGNAPSGRAGRVAAGTIRRDERRHRRDRTERNRDFSCIAVERRHPPSTTRVSARSIAAPAALATLGLLLAALPAVGRSLAPTDLGKEGLNVQGTSATATTFVRVPPGYGVRHGTVDLRFAHSTLLRAEHSTLTVLVNGVPRRSVRLTPANAAAGRVLVPFPSIADPRGGFALAARFGMRLTRDACEDPRNPALWARVLPSTSVDAVLYPVGRTVARALSNLAPPAASATTPIALPAVPSRAELAAAGIAAAALGTADAQVNADPLVELGPASPSRPGLLIASGAGTAAALRSFGLSRAVGTGAGVLAVSRAGAPRTLVAGSDAVGLGRAAAALAASPLTPAASAAEVVRGRAPAIAAASLPWRRSAASFAQLGIGPREVVGFGATTLDLPADRPAGWTLKDGGVLDLVVDPSGAMPRDGAAVTVDVGDERVGSRTLKPGGGPQSLRFSLPAGPLDRTLRGRARRSVALRLRFDLRVPGGRCELVDDDAARATVLETSSLTLPHKLADGRDLGRFPAPVASASQRATIVLPARPDPAETAAALQLAAAIGRWGDPGTPTPVLLRVPDLGDAGKHDGLVVVGRARRQLGVRIDVPRSAQPRPGEGRLTLAPSPFDDERDVLIVAGDDAGLALAARAVTQRTVLERLTGSAARVSTKTPEAVRAAVPAGTPPLALAPVLADDKGFFGSLPRWAVPAAVMLIAFAAFVAGLVRRRLTAARRS